MEGALLYLWFGFREGYFARRGGEEEEEEEVKYLATQGSSVAFSKQ